MRTIPPNFATIFSLFVVWGVRRLVSAASPKEQHKHEISKPSYLRNTTPAAASRQLQNLCSLRDPSVNFTSTVLVTLDTPLTSEEDQEALISAASLAAIILEDSPTICNPYFSQVTAVTTILDTTTSGSQPSNQIALQLSGICQGCDAVNTNLFQVDATPLILTSTTGICECPTNVVHRLPTLQEFTNAMNIALQDGDNPTAFIEVLEVGFAESKPCGGYIPTTAFTISAILELNGICGELSAVDANAVAAAYVKSYNAARVDEVCDPYQRQLISAVVVEQGSPIGGTLSIVLEVTGELSCLDEDNSESCTLEEIGLYDLPTTIVQVEGTRRKLQTSLCVCLDGTPDRGLYEDEFIDALRVELQGTMLECPTLTTGICDNTVFESAFSLTFEDSDAALAFLEGPSGATLEQDTLQFLNLVYNPADPSLCNPEFRQFEKVEYIILDDDGRRARSLQDLNETDIDEDMDLNATFAPTPAPTFAPPSGLSVILSASGVCTGCSNDLFFGNAIDGRRLTMERNLQAATEAMSTCFCGLETTVVIPTPEILEFETFVESTFGLEVSGIVPIPDIIPTSLEDPGDGETYTYPCTDEITTFLRNITLEVEYRCLASIDNTEQLLTIEEKTLIASAFQTAYNTLRAEVCDPFNVQVLEAIVVREGELREAGTSLPLEMEVTIGCNGCDKELTDLYGFPDEGIDETTVLEARRVLEESMPFGSNFLPVTTSRQTQELDGVCSCNATLPRRSPLEADVTDTMNPLLEELDLPCVGNTSECDFGRTFTTNILLEIEISPGVEPEEAARLLQIAYTNTLSRIISGGNATQCNSLFGLVLDSEFFLDFVYNSVPRGVNETSIDNLRRQLQIVEDDPLIDSDSRNETDILNATDVPTMAPTVTFAPTFTPGPTTASILILASGVCNGCPSDLFFGNAIDGRRLLTDGTTSEVEIMSTDDSNTRFLQDVTTPAVPESDCFCPIGSIDSASVFEPEVFTTALQAEIEDVAPGLNITSEPTYGVSEIDCSEETEFGTIVNFEFSAFQFVEEESNIGDVQGLGEVIAEIYNRLVPEFCDRFSRNSIQLTYIQGSLQPIGVGRRDRERNLQTVTTGCFNYVASFSVVGKCRGCLDLNSPIPVFGNNEVQQRDRHLLSSSLMDRSINEALRQRNIVGSLWNDGSNGDGIRYLQEEDETTCVCDASAVAARTAPSLSAVQGGLSSEIGGTLPWDRYPSICGLPVEVEEDCPLVPESSNELSYQSPLSIARLDNECLAGNDLILVGNVFVETFNEALQQEFDRCSPEYMQITSVLVPTTMLPACNRRLDSRNLNDLIETELQLRIQGSPFLQKDLQQLFVSLVFRDGQSTRARARRLSNSIKIRFEDAAASMGYRVALESSTTSPSGSPTEAPSESPSKTPTTAPTGLPSASPSQKPSRAASNVPTGAPSASLSLKPSAFGSSVPSGSPSQSPSISPSVNPSTGPSATPTTTQSSPPSSSLSSMPSTSSANPSVDPSASPSTSPSIGPSISLSSSPSSEPSASPSTAPSISPSAMPSMPSEVPSTGPSTSPSSSPSTGPSSSPSISPSTAPSASPSAMPSLSSEIPSTGPSASPSKSPSVGPSISPSTSPSSGPSTSPSTLPSISPSAMPSMPSDKPSTGPSTSPSISPSIGPSSSPSISPSTEPSASPSVRPSTSSASPSTSPSVAPSTNPSVGPSISPSTSPSSGPSSSPSTLPSISPSAMPSMPSDKPSTGPSISPSTSPSIGPSSSPSIRPSTGPSASPSTSPSTGPSETPACNEGVPSIPLDGTGATFTPLSNGILESLQPWVDDCPADPSSLGSASFTNTIQAKSLTVESRGGPIDLFRIPNYIPGDTCVEAGCGTFESCAETRDTGTWCCDPPVHVKKEDLFFVFAAGPTVEYRLNAPCFDSTDAIFFTKLGTETYEATPISCIDEYVANIPSVPTYVVVRLDLCNAFPDFAPIRLTMGSPVTLVNPVKVNVYYSGSPGTPYESSAQCSEYQNSGPTQEFACSGCTDLDTVTLDKSLGNHAVVVFDSIELLTVLPGIQVSCQPL